jgi:arginase
MIKLIGIPYDANSSFLRGPAQAPARIRLMEKEGSANLYAEGGKEIRPGVEYKDLGDLAFPDPDPQLGYAIIHNKVKEELNKEDKTICFGGDHSVSFPIIDAYSEYIPGLNVLHLDAHGDLYENFEDNPFSHASPFARLLEKGKIASLTQVGLRTLTDHQREQIKKYNVSIVEAKDFNYSFMKKLQGPLYISLDIDVLDPAYAPGVSHHEPGGLSTRQVLNIIQNLEVEIVGADIVEYNATRDLHNMTAMVAYKLFKEIVTKMT